MKIQHILISAALVISVIGCGVVDPDEDIIGSGPVVSRTVSVDNFQQISSSGIAEIHVSVGESQQLTLSAQKEILDVMTQEVIDKKLILDFKDDVNITTDKEIRIDISIPALLSVQSAGIGNVWLTGETQETLHIDLAGAGDLHAFDLEVNDCSIALLGTGSAYVQALESLSVAILGAGNVYYKGSPEIDLYITGSGSLVSRNQYPVLAIPIKKNITI